MNYNAKWNQQSLMVHKLPVLLKSITVIITFSISADISLDIPQCIDPSYKWHSIFFYHVVFLRIITQFCENNSGGILKK